LGLSEPAVAGFQTVREAAEQLGLTPWDVMRLVQAGEVQSVVLVETASIQALKEKS